MAVVIVKVNCKPSFVLFVAMFVLSSDYLHQNTRPINRTSPQTRIQSEEVDSCLGTGSLDGPSVLMKGFRGQNEHNNKQNNDKEENKGWFAIFFTITTTIRCHL